MCSIILGISVVAGRLLPARGASHQRPRRDCRRPASTIAYKIGAQRRRDDDQTIAFSRQRVGREHHQSVCHHGIDSLRVVLP